MPKIKPKIKKYKVIQEALERGIVWGLKRAKKHIENPSDEYITEQILYHINLELEEVIDYD
jgi:hypothetical protein